MGIPNNKIDNIKELCSQNSRDIKTYNKSVKEYFLDYKQ